jgi:hypothetical protein
MPNAKCQTLAFALWHLKFERFMEREKPQRMGVQRDHEPPPVAQIPPRGTVSPISKSAPAGRVKWRASRPGGLRHSRLESLRYVRKPRTVHGEGPPPTFWARLMTMNRPS